MLQVFIYVTAGNTIGAAVFLTLFRRDYLFSYEFLWQFIVIAAACAVGNLIFFSGKELSKKQMKIRCVIHYLYNSLAVVGGAFLFGWIAPGQTRYIIFMFIIFTVVFICIRTAMFKNEKKIAEDLNKKLRKYNKAEE